MRYSSNYAYKAMTICISVLLRRYMGVCMYLPTERMCCEKNGKARSCFWNTQTPLGPKQTCFVIQNDVMQDEMFSKQSRIAISIVNASILAQCGLSRYITICSTCTIVQSSLTTIEVNGYLLPAYIQRNYYFK